MFSNEIPLLSLSAENLGYIFWLGRILYFRGYLFWVRRRYRNSLGEALRFRIAIITQSSVDCGGWEFGAARKGPVFCSDMVAVGGKRGSAGVRLLAPVVYAR
jgi:hypothetical protein